MANGGIILPKKISSVVVAIMFFCLFSVAFAGSASAQVVMPLYEFQMLAREQGRDLQLLDLSKSQAELGLSIVEGEFGLSSDYGSKAMKKDMEALESHIDERLKAIKILKENIEEWEKEKEDAAADTLELEKKISRAGEELAAYQDEMDEVRPLYAKLVIRYHNTKSLEDMAEPHLEPLEKALEQIADAQDIQPRLIDYNVEQLYLTLLACTLQEELLEDVLKLAQRKLEIEELKHGLGMSTSLQVNAAKEDLQQKETALQNAKNEIKEYSRKLLYLAGLPLDFKFQTVPVSFSKEYQVADDEAMPDFTACVTYRSAYNDLQDAIEDLEDISEFDRKEHRLAGLKVEEAEVKLEKTLEGLEDGYLAGRDRFLLADSAVESAALSLEQAQRTLKAAELQHEIGMITILELKGSKLACMQSEYDHFSAMIHRQLAYQAYILAKDGIMHTTTQATQGDGPSVF